jgi:hypothetical protein
MLSQLAGLVADPGLQKTTHLFNLVSRREEVDLNDAIDALDKL